MSDEPDLAPAGMHTIALTNTYNAEKSSHTERIVIRLSCQHQCLRINAQSPAPLHGCLIARPRINGFVQYISGIYKDNFVIAKFVSHICLLEPDVLVS